MDVIATGLAVKGLQNLVGRSRPPATMGMDGAYYTDVTTGNIYQRLAGVWRIIRFAGPMGYALDSVSRQLYAAYGLSRLLSAYAGPCIRVRRASDNAEADIGFAADGWLDTAALLAHAGTASAYITTWYDQVGGSVHSATQATGGQQPRIVNAGVIDTGPSGRPVMTMSAASTTSLGIANALDFNASAPALSIACIATATNRSTSPAVFATGGRTGGRWWTSLSYEAATSKMVLGTLQDPPDVGADWLTIPAPVGLARTVACVDYMGGKKTLSYNGVTVTRAYPPGGAPSAGGVSYGPPRIGSWTEGAYPMDGMISCLVLARAALDIAALDAALAEIMS